MATTGTTIKDRVREHTPVDENMAIDQKIKDRLTRYQDLTKNEIDRRLEKLQKEWDIERTLEVNASSLALTGIVLGTFFSRRWFVLPFVVAGFLLQHGIQGWCPPLTLFRKLGVRTRQEIDEEIYALKTLRGDFESVSPSSSPVEIIAAFRK